MGMPALQERRWTAAQVRAMQDEDRQHGYQVVDGDLLVTPAPRPRHQACVREFVRVLADYVESVGGCEVFSAPGEISTDEHTSVQPDVFVALLSDSRPAESWDDIERLLLVVEVLSPATALFDRTQKRVKYLELGATYWIVDADARVVEVWEPGSTEPAAASTVLVWTAPNSNKALHVDLPALFRRVFGR